MTLSVRTCARCNKPLLRIQKMYCSQDCFQQSQRDAVDKVRLARFIALRDQGLSASGIAARYFEETGQETTRNAVIGLLNRYARRQRKAKPPTYRRPPRKPKREPAPPQDARLLSIHELKSTTCRWPIGESPSIRFCGAECSPEAPYCEFHTVRSRSTGREGRHYATRRQILAGGYR